MSIKIGKAVRYSGLWLAVAVLLQACGGGSGGSSASTTPVSFVKRAGVSAYAGSTVDIEYYDSVNGWQALASLSTSAAGSLTEMGLFDSSDTPFQDDSWYRFTVSGGVNPDADRDGVLDAESTAIKGRLRSLAKGQWLQAQGGTHISAATEFAYTSLHKLLVADDIDWAAVEAGLHYAAEKLLLADQTGDGEINAADLLAQDPQSLEDNLHFYQRNQLAKLSALVNAGVSSQLTGTLNGKALGASSQSVNEMVMSSDGRMIYAAISRDGVLIYDAQTSEETVVDTKVSLAQNIALSESRERLYVAGRSAGVEVVDLASQTLADPLLASYGYVYDIQVSPDESELYVATTDGLLIYDVDAGTYAEFLNDACATLTLSEDGSRLGMGCFSGIKVYDVASAEITHEVDLDRTAYTVLLDGDAAYVANEGDGLTVVDLSTGDYDSYATPNNESLLALAPHADEGSLAAFSEEGNYVFDLASRTYGGSVIADMENGYTEYVFYSSRYDTYLFDYYAYVGEVLETADLIDVIDGSDYVFNVAADATADKIFYSDYASGFGVYSPETGGLESYDIPGDVGGFAVNAAQTTAYVIWINNGYRVLDLTDGSYETVDLSKSVAHPVLDENAGLLYLANFDSDVVEVYSLTTNSLVKTLDMGSCDPTFLRLSTVENALDVACRADGIKRMNLDTDSWTQIVDNGYLYSFDYNADESLIFVNTTAGLVVHNTETDTAVKTISYTAANAHMAVYSTKYWAEMNAVIIGGNQGARFVSLETEEQYWLHLEYGNSFALDKARRQIYLAAANDAGLMVLDMSDFE